MSESAAVGALVYLMGVRGGSPLARDVEPSRSGAMARLRVKFTFPPDLVREPIIWEIGRRFDLVTNIRRADITAEVAWATLEIDGEEEEIERGIKWVTEKGVRVDPVEDSIIEG